jgi:hypothetical protein
MSTISAQEDALMLVRSFARDCLAAERACLSEPSDDAYRELERRAASHLYIAPDNIQSLPFGRACRPGHRSDLSPALVQAAEQLAEMKLFLLTAHERNGLVFCAYVSCHRAPQCYSDVLHLARMGDGLKIVGKRAVNPFSKGGKLAFEAAGGDQFKRLAKPISVLKVERPSFAAHAAHYDSLTATVTS